MSARGNAPDYDLVVLGAGSAGVRASRVAAELGARVAVVESGPLGGTCVNAGCVPKKLLWFGAERARALADAHGFGLHVRAPELRWHELMAGKDREVQRLNAAYGRTLEGSGVTVLHGRAHLRDRSTVAVDGTPYTAKYVLVATGGVPFVPAIPGAALGLTSDDVLQLRELPRRVAIVGAGVIATELAGVLHAFGAEVALVYRRDEILADLDAELGVHLAAELRKQGMALHPRAVVTSIEREADGLRVALGDDRTLRCDAVIFATGRMPRTHALGLTEVGVQLDTQGAVVVDAHGRTSVDNIFAAGDCIGGHALTPLAIAQGQAVARTLFGGGEPQPIHPELIPRAVFTHPAVATVGLTEAEARRASPNVRIYFAKYKPLEHALSGRDERALVKLCVDGRDGRVLGCHMVAAEAPEVIQGFAVAMRCGATKEHFDTTLGIHPTAAEELVTLRTARP